MPALRAVLLVAPLAAWTACSVPPARPARPADEVSTAPRPAAKTEPAPPRPTAAQQAGGGNWGDRTLLEVMYLPVVWLERDDSVSAGSNETLTGPGFGLRAAVGNRDQSVGILYQAFQVDTAFADVDLHSFYVDFDVRLPVTDDKGVWFVRTGAGLGTAWIDASDQPDGSSELAAQIRLGFDFQPNETFAVDIGFGGLAIGHPGDTEAYGTFVTLGAVLTF